MFSLILATEAVISEPAGDSIQTFAYALLGILLIVAAIATLVVTPGAESQD